MARTAAQRRRDAEKHPEWAMLPDNLTMVFTESGDSVTHAAPTVSYRGTVIPDFHTLCDLRVGYAVRDRRKIDDLDCRKCRNAVEKRRAD